MASSFLKSPLSVRRVVEGVKNSSLKKGTGDRHVLKTVKSAKMAGLAKGQAGAATHTLRVIQVLTR
jgi:hypothetical protein